MKPWVVLRTSTLALVLGAAAFAAAQHDQHDQRGQEGDSHRHDGNVHQQEHGRKSSPQEGRHQGNGPEQRHEYRREPWEAVQSGPEHQPHGGYAPGHLHEARRDEPESRYRREDIWQRQRAHDWQREHHPWHERGGYHGYRIPEDRFRAHFGRGHWFRVHEVPVIVVERSPRFQIGGFWFSVVDPCPETWSPVWYRTDDVYIDYVDDGYYMYNRQHPGIAIAVNVSL
jgi:hypothetical protein